MYVCMYACMHACMHVCMYVCVDVVDAPISWFIDNLWEPSISKGFFVVQSPSHWLAT